MSSSVGCSTSTHITESGRFRVWSIVSGSKSLLSKRPWQYRRVVMPTGGASARRSGAGLGQVPDGDDAHHAIVLKDREVTEAPLQHHVQRPLRAVVRPDGGGVLRHPVADGVSRG